MMNQARRKTRPILRTPAGEPPAVVSIFPEEGAAGTSVTVELDPYYGTYGATGMTLGGVAVTDFEIVDGTRLRGVAGAHANGVVPLRVRNQWGEGFKPNAFTYGGTPPDIETLFGLALRHLWDSYDGNTGVWTDSVGGADAVVVDGTPTEGVRNGRRYPIFNGLDNGLEAPDVSTLDGLSTWCIFGAFRTNNGDGFGAIIDHSLQIYVEFSGSSLAISSYSGGDISGSVAVNDNEWHRFIVSVTDLVGVLYIDGVAAGSVTFTALTDFAVDPLLLGKQPVGTVTDAGILLVGIATTGGTITEVDYLDGLLVDAIGVDTGPTVTAIAPDYGDPAGGTWVEITVADSTGCTEGSIGGSPLTSFAVLDSTHVGGFTSAHALSATAVDVVVSNATGTSSLPSAFTYAFESYAWSTRTLSGGWYPRDGAMLVYFNAKWWMLGGWDPLTLTAPWQPDDTTNEVWSSPDLATWTQELAHDVSPPTSGAGARWKRRHWFGCFVHNHAGTDYIYVLGSDASSADDPEFIAAPSNRYPSDVWRSANGTTWERVCASDDTSWSGRTLTVFGSSPGKLWAFGGQNGVLAAPHTEAAIDCVVHNDLHVSTDGGATWTVALADAAASATRPSGRGMTNRLAYWQGRLWLVSGGTTQTAAAVNREYHREVWSIDPGNTAAGWTQHANGPWLGVQYSHVEIFRGRMWLIAGYSGDGFDGLDHGENIRHIWSTGDGERWRRHECPPWVATHAVGTAVNDDGDELGFVAGNGALTTAPYPADPGPGQETAYALVATPAYSATTVPSARGIWKASDAVTSGANIVSIADSSGSGGPALIPTSAGDATYNASDSDYGGAASAETTGAGHFLKTDSAIDLSTFTIFIVGRWAQTPGAFYTLYALTNPPLEYVYEFGAIDGTYLDRVAREFKVERGGLNTIGSGAVLFDNDEIQHIYVLHYDGTAAGSQYRIDGAKVIPKDAANVGDAGSATWPAVLHILSDSTGGFGKPATVAEIRVYPALTQDQIHAVEDELRAAYPYTPPP